MIAISLCNRFSSTCKGRHILPSPCSEYLVEEHQALHENSALTNIRDYTREEWTKPHTTICGAPSAALFCARPRLRS